MKFIKYLVLCPFFAFAQVGIGTVDPKGILHIDGKSDTHLSNSNVKDDIVISNAGNLGLGTITPAAKVTIVNDSDMPSIRITDGTQGAGKLLISDANGVATWSFPKNSDLIIGEFQNGGISYKFADHSGDALIYTKSFIDLPQGTWEVNYVILFQVSATTDVNADNWIELNTTFVNVNNTTAQTVISGDVYGQNRTNSHIYAFGASLSVLKGSIIINNTSTATKRYGLALMKPTRYANENSKNIRFLNFASKTSGENLISATKVVLD